jgi:hypothetical protein
MIDFFTDQPGRVLAVCVLGPVLMWKARTYDDIFIALFAATLIVWDAWWLLFKDPRQIGQSI